MTVLLISTDAVDVQMAGPGIRIWEIAKHLARKHDVLLLVPNRSSLSHPRVTIIQRSNKTFAESLKQADVIVTQGFGFPLMPVMLSRIPLIVDLSFPLSVELLEHHSHLPLNEAQLSHSYCVERTKLLLHRGDFFLYSHEHQRDYWIGMLTAIGRLTHRIYRDDPSAARLFGCVPFGISSEPPVQTRPVFQGPDAIFPQERISSETDTLILWGGGLWRWFDPCSVIRAIGEISKERQDIKLLFIGCKRPHTEATGVNIAYTLDEAIALSHQIGVYNQTVFFNSQWVPYQDWGSYLLEGDIGVSTHFENLETRFSFRTRLLDYLWAELPIIATQGDYFSKLIEQHQLGITVAPASVPQIQAAILRLADDHAFADQCRANIRRIRSQFMWSEILQPLEAFCAQPYTTCSLSLFGRWMLLLEFYGNTGKNLIKYRGYKKIFAKLKRILF